MGRWSRRLAPALVTFAEVHDDEDVLDVGSGTGALSFALREATRTTRVTGIDPSAEYVAWATKQGTTARVRFVVGDAQRLPFADAAFHKTMSMLVLNFVPDARRAVREMVRVTKPGGVVAAAVWDYGEGMEMLRIFWDEATALDPSLAARDEARMPHCKKGELDALWSEAGLTRIEPMPLTVELDFASFDDFWSPFTMGQGPAGDCVTKMDTERRAALVARLRTRLLGERADGRLTMHARAYAVKGVRV